MRATAACRRKKMPCTVTPQKRCGWSGRKMMSSASQLVRAETTAPKTGIVKIATARCGHAAQIASWTRPNAPPISAPLLRMNCSSGLPISIIVSTASCGSLVRMSITSPRMSKRVESRSDSLLRSSSTASTIWGAATRAISSTACLAARGDLPHSRGAATATAASTASAASWSNSAAFSRTSPSASTRPTHSCGEMSDGMRLSHALSAKGTALKGMMPCHPRPTFVRGMRRQPTKLTGLKVIHSASQMWV
mmetsp:Transcript_42207/g.136977  ORF Transcript_42207/g.136977 Transcript_42207/m.136977 type:complete len:250 (-) Transcript_42207:413-1162(-)